MPPGDPDLSHMKSEGDLNISLLHQSLSTPCLNVLAGCDGIYLEDLQGNRYIDFHGNNVHQVGFGNPKVISLIGDVRGIGLLLGIELVKDRATRVRAADEAEQIMYRSLTRGLNFKLTMGSILTLTPPLTITLAEMDRALDIIADCLTEVESSRGVA